MNLHWQSEQWIHLAWPALALLVILLVLELRSSERLSALVQSTMQPRLVRAPSRVRRIVRVIGMAGFLCMAIVALMRPQTSGRVEIIKTQRVIADVVVVLDVSKSMLAEDAAPNRLKRAKADVNALVDELPGHRVGLVAFAGKATLLCPLTRDHGFFRSMLRGANDASVSRGGTHIGEALRLAIRSFDPDTSTSRMIVLITDGEDHDGFARDAAGEAKDLQIRIVTVGFGSEEGAPLQLTNPATGAREPLVDRGGTPVISRVDADLLREIALTTEGAFVPAKTGALDLPSIVAEHLEPMFEDSRVETTRRVPREWFPWALWAALFFVLLTVWSRVVSEKVAS